MNKYSIKLEDGKYEFVIDTDTGILLECLRHGESWEVMFEQVRFSKVWFALLTYTMELEQATNSAPSGDSQASEDWGYCAPRGPDNPCNSRKRGAKCGCPEHCRHFIAAPQALPEAAPVAIYQLSGRTEDNTWRSVDKATYDYFTSPRIGHLGQIVYTAAPVAITLGMDRSAFHDKAWALYQSKALDDAKLPKLSIYAIRTLWNALYDSMPTDAAPASEPIAPPIDVFGRMMIDAAVKSGDEGAIKLALQLANVQPCEKCGYVHYKCRCETPSEPIARDVLENAIRNTIGFNFEPHELQTVNEDDLMRIAHAILDATPIARDVLTMPEGYIELNMSNYGADDVSQLNQWAIEAYAILEAAREEKS